MLQVFSAFKLDVWKMNARRKIVYFGMHGNP